MNAADYLEERADQAKHEAEDRADEILQLEARIERFREYRVEALAREAEMRRAASVLRDAEGESEPAAGAEDASGYTLRWVHGVVPVTVPDLGQQSR